MWSGRAALWLSSSAVRLVTVSSQKVVKAGALNQETVRSQNWKKRGKENKKCILSPWFVAVFNSLYWLCVCVCLCVKLLLIHDFYWSFPKLVQVSWHDQSGKQFVVKRQKGEEFLEEVLTIWLNFRKKKIYIFAVHRDGQIHNIYSGKRLHPPSLLVEPANTSNITYRRPPGNVLLHLHSQATLSGTPRKLQIPK